MAKEVDIIFTNPIESYKFYTIKQTSADIITIPSNSKAGAHFTYHLSGDGTFHYRENKLVGKKDEGFKNPTLFHIEDNYTYLVITGIIKDGKPIGAGVPFNHKDSKNVVSIDTSHFKNFFFRIKLSLMKHEKISDLLKSLPNEENKNNCKFVQIIKEFNPSLVVHVMTQQNEIGVDSHS